MPFIIADRVQETSTTVGTGSLALAGGVTGYQTFGAVLNTADTTYYTAAQQGGPEWEVGVGTFTAPSTLARTTILSSSNGGSIVNFPAGTKSVFMGLPASRTVQSFSGGSTGLTPSTNSFGPITLGGTLAIGNGGTGATTGETALSNLGGLPLTGGTLTGALAVTAGTVSAPGLAASGDSNTGIFFPAADTIAFAEGGTEAMRLDASGNLGLGVVSPAARFDLGGDYKEGVVTANTGTAYTIALTGTVQNLTLTGNCTFTFPAATLAGRSFLLILRQDATGSRAATWPAVVRWPGGTAPTITATASRYDLYAFTADGSVWLGRVIAQNYAA